MSRRSSSSSLQLDRAVRRATGATSVGDAESIQTLWSGYGEIVRLPLVGAALESVIVKRVTPPTEQRHPRGWAGERSHKRKLRSYEVEMNFYRSFAEHTTDACRVPRLLHGERANGGWLFVLEDLDAAGFPGRRGRLRSDELDACLRWLAAFHARFLGANPEGLWKVGTYWHLATRPEELAAMQHAELKRAAGKLDARLNGCSYQTLVHGDAKVANFCFADEGVAAVDFQYVGGGVGIKDVAYFLSSCLDEHECAAMAEQHLDTYFAALRRAVAERDEGCDLDALESSWRELYPVAWADFYRFLDGWAPGHYKLHGYSQEQAEAALRSLG